MALLLPLWVIYMQVDNLAQDIRAYYTGVHKEFSQNVLFQIFPIWRTCDVHV